jgi:hypothetical protein
VLAALAASGAAGCGGGSAAHHTAPVASTYTRTCSQVGSGGLAHDYRRHALLLGPVALGNVRSLQAGEPLPGAVGPRRGAYEVIAIVSAGADATLSVPRAEWPTVGVLYDPSKFRDDGAYLLADLDHAVRFQACPSPSFNHGVSQFDGGFVVTRPQCVHVLVTTSRGRVYRGEFAAAARCRS